MAERRMVAHLLHRVTFGPTAAEVDAAERDGVAATLTTLLPTDGPPGDPATGPELGPDPYAALPAEATRDQKQKARAAQQDQVRELSWWWLRRMTGAAGAASAAEKLVFFWHGHWATSVRKVRSAALMLGQQQTFRRYGYGDTGPLVRAMLRDPALILWLDGQRNTRQAPNENLARELMELFTLGVGHYTENDVKAGARALTGWQVDRRTGAVRLAPKRHDATASDLLGSRGAFDVDGYADLLVRQPAHPAFLAGRLWLRYASDVAPSEAVTARLVTAFGPGRDVTAVLRALLADPDFAATAGTAVKQPVEWLTGAMRQLGVDASALDDAHRKPLLTGLQALGQVPLRPPSVGGWPSGAAWLTTSSAQARLRTGQALAALAPGAIESLAATGRTDRVDALARMLVVDSWTARTRTALTDVAGEPKRLLALGLATPEYAVH